MANSVEQVSSSMLRCWLQVNKRANFYELATKKVNVECRVVGGGANIQSHVKIRYSKLYQKSIRRIDILWNIMEYHLRMKSPYTARAKRNQGRKSYVITFRHPMKLDNGKPGKKVFRGLGTAEPERANELEVEMNSLLSREDLHSVSCREQALKEFDPAIVEIFYGDLDPTVTGHRELRARLLPLPPMKSGNPVRSLLLGNSGVGKTTLLRRLIGCDAERDRFPATSANRTTTCEIEIWTGQAEYSSVITFLTRHQVQQEVSESLSNAVLKAIEKATDERVMKDFLDDPDQRFRLKYSLGGWRSVKSYTQGALSFTPNLEQDCVEETNSDFLTSSLDRIREIAIEAQREVETELGFLDDLKDEAHSFALDEMQRHAELLESFQDLVSETMDEIVLRFENCSEGKFTRSSTGWPEAWTYHSPATQRDSFLTTIRSFCSNTKSEWGTLLTPMVTGIRVSGPFRPEWVKENEPYENVFIDTQGLDHEKPTTELSSETTTLFSLVQNIVFVESGKDSLKNQSARKVMEAIASSGYTSALTVVLTHMDLVVGEDIPNEEDRKAKAFGGLRSLVENEVQRNVSREASRQLSKHLDSTTFYLAYVDAKTYPESWNEANNEDFEELMGSLLTSFTQHLTVRGDPQLLQPSIPSYSFESLGLAVQEASVAFHDVWKGRLGYKRVEGISPAPWQSIKAMSWRYADGYFDGFWLRPIDTLVSQTRNVLTRFLEKPLDWSKAVSVEEKEAIIDRLKQLVSEELTELSRKRIWKDAQTEWQSAYEPRGAGSTFKRKQRVRELLGHQVPIPQSTSDQWAQKWVDEIKELLIKAIETLKNEADE